MTKRGSTPRPAEAAPRDPGAAERIVVAVLLLMAGLLAYVRFVVLPRARMPTEAEFDLRNPILDVKAGDCVELEDSSNPGVVVCLTAVGPPVLRSREGPDRIGETDGLRRSAPYLHVLLTYPEAGQGCSSRGKRQPEHVFFDLGGFGMNSRIHSEPLTIRPMWRRWGGKERFTYEVQVLRYGVRSGPWVFWLAEDAPLTGTVFRTFTTSKGAPTDVVFRETDCPPR